MRSHDSSPSLKYERAERKLVAASVKGGRKVRAKGWRRRELGQITPIEARSQSLRWPIAARDACEQANSKLRNGLRCLAAVIERLLNVAGFFRRGQRRERDAVHVVAERRSVFAHGA